jgi:hypothetical protein
LYFENKYPFKKTIIKKIVFVTGQLPKAVYSRRLLENQWCNREMGRGF